MLTSDTGFGTRCGVYVITTGADTLPSLVVVNTDQKYAIPSLSSLTVYSVPVPEYTSLPSVIEEDEDPSF